MKRDQGAGDFETEMRDRSGLDGAKSEDLYLHVLLALGHHHVDGPEAQIGEDPCRYRQYDEENKNCSVLSQASRHDGLRSRARRPAFDDRGSLRCGTIHCLDTRGRTFISVVGGVRKGGSPRPGNMRLVEHHHPAGAGPRSDSGSWFYRSAKWPCGIRKFARKLHFRIGPKAARQDRQLPGCDILSKPAKRSFRNSRGTDFRADIASPDQCCRSALSGRVSLMHVELGMC